MWSQIKVTLKRNKRKKASKSIKLILLKTGFLFCCLELHTVAKNTGYANKMVENFNILQQEIENTDIRRERDFSTLVQVFFQPWGIRVAKLLCTNLHPDRRHQHRHPHLQDLLHCSCTLQSKCKLLCKASHYRHSSIALFGNCRGIHSKLTPSRLVSWRQVSPNDLKAAFLQLPSMVYRFLIYSWL